MTTIDHPTAVEKFTTFFEDYNAEIRRIADVYPEETALVLPYSDIDRDNLELAEFLITNPNNAFYAAQEAIKVYMHPDKTVDVGFRLVNLPKDMKTPIRSIRSRHLGKLVVTDGLVRKTTFVKPRLLDGSFECLRCGQVIKAPQEDTNFKEPLECYKDQGGCGRAASSVKFRLLAPDSEWSDFQKIEIQEAPEGLAGGAEPQRLVAFANNDLAGIVSPGDRITVIGTLRTQTHSGNKPKSTVFDVFLDVNNIEISEKDFEEIVITPEEEENILAASQDENICQQIVGSIAPNIYGMEMEKEALAIQLFGGVAKHLNDGTRIRGDIHVLLIGDPGTAKSQLLTYIGELAPRAVRASGKSASGAGLTCAAVKDDFGEGRWTLEAGALVLADRGMAIVDEFDKMSKDDRSSMHEAMEQQRISVAKAGITATLQSRCSCLAAANPKYGRFDEHSLISEQINIPIALLSRFDVILTVTDKPEAERDRAISQHIVNVHVSGQMREASKIGHVDDIGWDDGMAGIYTPRHEQSFLRRYIAYSKTHISPILTPNATKMLTDFYRQIRKSTGDSECETVPLTARQLEGLIRLAEASARMRLSSVATEQDAKRAIRILEYYLNKVAGVDDGRYDIDMITTGTSASLKKKINTIKDILRDLGKDGDVINRSDVTVFAENKGIEERDTETVLLRLCRDEAFIYFYGDSGRKYKLNSQ